MKGLGEMSMVTNKNYSQKYRGINGERCRKCCHNYNREEITGKRQSSDELSKVFYHCATNIECYRKAAVH